MKKIRQQHLREVRAGKRGCPPGLGAAERGVQHPHHPIIPCPGSSHVQLADFSQAGIANGDSVCAWGRSGIAGRGMGGAFCNDCSCLAAISGPQRPCAAGRAACCPRRLAGCSLPSQPCEQVLPAMIHVVSDRAAVGGHPGAEPAPCSGGPRGCCSRQGLPSLGGGVCVY